MTSFDLGFLLHTGQARESTSRHTGGMAASDDHAEHFLSFLLAEDQAAHVARLNGEVNDGGFLPSVPETEAVRQSPTPGEEAPEAGERSLATMEAGGTTRGYLPSATPDQSPVATGDLASYQPDEGAARDTMRGHRADRPGHPPTLPARGLPGATSKSFTSAVHHVIRKDVASLRGINSPPIAISSTLKAGVSMASFALKDYNGISLDSHARQLIQTVGHTTPSTAAGVSPPSIEAAIPRVPWAAREVHTHNPPPAPPSGTLVPSVPAEQGGATENAMPHDIRSLPLQAESAPTPTRISGGQITIGAKWQPHVDQSGTTPFMTQLGGDRPQQPEISPRPRQSIFAHVARAWVDAAEGRGQTRAHPSAPGNSGKRPTTGGKNIGHPSPATSPASSITHPPQPAVIALTTRSVTFDLGSPSLDTLAPPPVEPETEELSRGIRHSTEAASPSAIHRASVSAPRHLVSAIMRQVQTAILREGRAANGAVREIRISLRPERLGQVDIRIEMKDDVSRAVIRAETPQALDILRSDVRALEQSLRDMGHRFDGGIEFEAREDGHDDHRWEDTPAEGRGEHKAGRAEVSREDEQQTQPESSEVVAVGASELNLVV